MVSITSAMETNDSVTIEPLGIYSIDFLTTFYLNTLWIGKIEPISVWFEKELLEESL